MSKGKFSRSHKEGDEELLKKLSRALQEDETVILPQNAVDPTESPQDPTADPEDRSMPQWDFESFSDLEDLKANLFPELSALDVQSEDSEFHTRFQEIPPTYTPEEKAQIEETFQEVLAETEKKKPRSLSPKRKKGIIFFAAAIFLLTAVVFSGTALYHHFSDPYNHKILNGVMVAGINLGNMTRKQAEEAVSAAADAVFSHQDMVIRLPGQTLKLSPAATKIALKSGAAVKEAYEYGRNGSKEEQAQAFQDSMTKTVEIDILPYLQADEGYILRQFQGYADAYDSGYTPSSYALEGEQPPLDYDNFNEKNTTQTLLLILGNPGFHLDSQQALADVMKAYSQMDLEPDLKLQAGDKEPEPLDLNRIYKEYHIDPVNSSMDPESFDIISGSYGYTFDLQTARRLLTEAHYGDTVRVPMEYVIPDTLDHEVYFQDVLGTAETPHGNNKNRNVNLDIACKALNGIVLNPGDEFSYNQTLGERTAEKGYQAAPAYSGDKLVNSLGGGICQVSSTLYLSCLMADLEITDRINHGFLASYIDPGMDATVSWNGPDYKFRNNSDFPIQIQAEATEDKVIIKILGTDVKDYYIKMEYEMSNVLPHEIYEDHDASSGYKDGEVIRQGTLGHHVKTYRCKYSKKTNVLISRELEARSSYMSRDRVIARVKAPDPTEPSVAPETTPSNPEPTNPAPTVPTDPVPTTPAPTDPAPTTPAPTDPEPTNPEPPAPSEPKPTEPPAPPATEPPAPQPTDTSAPPPESSQPSAENNGT